MKRENLITEHLAMGLLDTEKQLLYGVIDTGNYPVMAYAFVAGDTSDCLEDVGCSPEDIEAADKLDIGGVHFPDWIKERAIVIIKLKDARL
jgi:hypothetical protein